jgi:hypothetical protein
MASGLVLTSAGSAAADPANAGPGQLVVCSDGDYASYVQEWNWSTEVVNPGQCNTVGVGNSQDVQTIYVYGIDKNSGDSFGVGTGYIRPSRGGNVDTFGSEGNAWADTPRT